MNETDTAAQERAIEERQCWQRHRAEPGEDTLVELVRLYIPLVTRIVRQMAVYTPHYMDNDDLTQHALMGLWSSIERYDETKGVPFEAFALLRIRGAVRDALRRHDPLTRTERDIIKKLDTHTQHYINRYGEAPDEESLAEMAGITVEQLNALLIKSQPWISLDSSPDTDPERQDSALSERLTDRHAPDPGREAIRQERREFFREAFKHLNVRQQKILYLYYFEELTLKEIGTILELTEARICQLHAAALLALRAILTRQARR